MLADASLGDQINQLVMMVALAIVTTLLGYAKAWWEGRKLGSSIAAGVDMAEQRMATALAAHPVLGPVLKANGLTPESIAAHLDDVLKGGIRAVAEATGVQARLDALVHSDVVTEVKRATQAERPAVDANGKPLAAASFPLPLVLLAFVLALGAAGCCSAIPPDHAALDRKEYELLGKRQREYIANDARLTPAQKARRLRTVDWWGYQVGATTTAVPLPEEE